MNMSDVGDQPRSQPRTRPPARGRTSEAHGCESFSGRAGQPSPPEVKRLNPKGIAPSRAWCGFCGHGHHSDNCAVARAVTLSPTGLARALPSDGMHEGVGLGGHGRTTLSRQTRQIYGCTLKEWALPPQPEPGLYLSDTNIYRRAIVKACGREEPSGELRPDAMYNARRGRHGNLSMCGNERNFARTEMVEVGSNVKSKSLRCFAARQTWSYSAGIRP